MLLCTLAAYFPTTELAAIDSASIWQDYTSNPDNHPNIPNNSFAGYRNGEEEIPYYSVVVDVTDYGAVGDGTTDNTIAFRNAIDAAWLAGGGAVYIPAGTYRIEELIHLNRNGVALRGAGRDFTTLVFPNSLSSIVGADMNGSGSQNRWSWQGGLIWVAPEVSLEHGTWNKVLEWEQGSYPGGTNWNAWWSGNNQWVGPELAAVSGSYSRGAWSVDVADSSQLKEGDYYLLAWETTQADLSFFKHVAGHPLMESFDWDGADALLARSQWQWPVQIEAINGNTISLAQPLRVDIRPEWNVAFEPIGETIENVGLEDFSIQMLNVPLTSDHNKNAGWNAVFFTKALNSWVKNIRIIDAENGILARSNKGLEYQNIEITGAVSMHHGTTHVRTHDSLVEDFTITSDVHHGISVEDLSSGVTYHQGWMEYGTFDSHRFMPFDILRTDIALNNEEGSPGGANDFGPFVGKNVVHWNINVTGTRLNNGNDVSGLYVFQPDAHSMGMLVGIQGAPINLSNGWGMVPGDKGTIVADTGIVPEPEDLYQSQFNLRKNTQKWIHLAEPVQDIMPPGQIILKAAPNAASDAIEEIKFYSNNELIGVATSAPWEIVWDADFGLHNLHVTMKDSSEVVLTSLPKQITIGHRIIVQEDYADLTYFGAQWKKETNPLYYGGILQKVARREAPTVAVEIPFHGTRIQWYTAINNAGQSVDIYLDGEWIRSKTIHRGTAGFRYRGYQSPVLADGAHLLRIEGTSVQVDAFVIDQTSGATSGPQAPFASFTTLPSTGYAPLSVAFNAASSFDSDGVIETYDWTFGDGGIATGSAPSHVFTDPGSYNVVLTIVDNDGIATTSSTTVTVLTAPDSVGEPIDFNSATITPVSGQNSGGSASSNASGDTFTISGNTWQQIEFPYLVTEHTVLKFDVKIDPESEIHGIGFGNGDDIDSSKSRFFQLAGSQNWGINAFYNYSGNGWVSYSIPVGEFYTGFFPNLLFINDDDANAGAEISFKNVVVYEAGIVPLPQPPKILISTTSAGLVINWEAAEGDFLYQLEESDTLGSGWTLCPTEPVISGTSYTVTTSIADTKFYRVKVTSN